MGDETSLPSAQFSWDHETALKILFVYKKERKKTVWGAHYLFLLGERDKLGQEVGWGWGSGVLGVRAAWGLSGWVWTGDPIGRCRWGPHGQVWTGTPVGGCGQGPVGWCGWGPVGGCRRGAHGRVWTGAPWAGVDGGPWAGVDGDARGRVWTTPRGALGPRLMGGSSQCSLPP